MSDSPTSLPVALGQAERFLALLDPTGRFTFQTFDDSPAKSGELAKVLHGTLGQRTAELKALNERGAGVFVTVNATDLKGRKEANIVAVRALFVDLDGSPIQPVRDGPLAPHIQVESSPGRWHAYWLVRDLALAQFKPLQKGLAARFAGDRSVNDLPRVMRLPGFIHRKAAPAMSLLASVADHPPFTLAEVLAAFGWASAEAADPEQTKARAAPRTPAAPSGQDDVIDDLVEALSFIPADGYEEWKNVAFALKTLGARGEPLFHDWASRSAKYSEPDSSKLWARAQPSQTSHQAVFKLAQQFGWDASNSPSIRRKREERGRAPSREEGPIAPMPPDELLGDELGHDAADDGGEALPVELPVEPPKTLEECLRRFELIYGGNKVWDTSTSQEISFAGLVAMVGKEMAKGWQSDSTKRTRIVPKAPTKEKPKKGESKADPTKLAMLLERYALIYGTEVVFDRHEHMEVPLGALRAYAGLQAVRAWTDHPHRKVVRIDQIVFNPRIPVDSEEFCNLYSGWPIEAAKGDAGDQELCRRWRAVLFYAVGENNEVFEWLLKWMAYQVRYPGTKMKTSVIFHGPEGSGKNTVWDGFRRIFGKYGRSITQTQLESQYTDWMGGKFFIVGNEVLHRQEQVQQKGRLKTLITEDEFSLERKFLPGREEPNYCNLVFLSNESIPLALDPNDRRFLVVWTPAPHPEGAKFYAGLSQKEMPDSAVRAIYHFLLEVELGEFGPHTKPPMTAAKEQLIDASMASAPRFLRQWLAGEIEELPVHCCRTQHLFDGYMYWCRRKGERFPWPENRFAAEAKKAVPSGKKRFFHGTAEKQGMMYLPTLASRAHEENVSESMYLGREADFFAQALDKWRNGQ